jgi:hypothetical protein
VLVAASGGFGGTEGLTGRCAAVAKLSRARGAWTDGRCGGPRPPHRLTSADTTWSHQLLQRQTCQVARTAPATSSRTNRKSHKTQGERPRKSKRSR